MAKCGLWAAWCCCWWALARPAALWGQSDIYVFQTQRDLGLLAGGLGVGGTGLWLGSRVKPLTSTQIQQLTGSTVGWVDRYAVQQYSLRAADFSDFMGMSSLALPLLVLALPTGREHWEEIGLIGFEGALLTASLTHFAKVVSLRPRPFVRNPVAPLSEKQAVGARYAYFSGHVSLTAFTSFVGAQFFADLYPHSRWKPAVWGVAAAIPALTAYGRMRAGKHYFTDVATGYILGAAVGIILPRLHHLRDKRRADLLYFR